MRVGVFLRLRRRREHSAKAFEEAHERHEHGHEGASWVPLRGGARGLAAVSGYLGNLRSTQALVEKNDAIVATTKRRN